MEGVELMDRLISCYPMTFRTKGWPTRVILHLFIVRPANAWIKYCGRERKKGMKLSQILLDLLSFWEEVGQAELSPNPVRGRSSFQSLLNYCPIPEKKRDEPFALFLIFVMTDLRYHWPEGTQIKSFSFLACQRTLLIYVDGRKITDIVVFPSFFFYRCS